MKDFTHKKFNVLFSVDTDEEVSGKVTCEQNGQIMSFSCKKGAEKKFKFDNCNFGIKIISGIVDHLVSYTDLKFGKTFIWVDKR